MPDASDALFAAGSLLLVAAVVALAGTWWGVGLLGCILALAGMFGGH